MATDVTSRSPYQLDLKQTTQACKVLLRHVVEERKRRGDTATKPNLLQGDGSDDEEGEEGNDQEPIWLIMSTKKHIVDQKRLKPNKIALPHPINASDASIICLITADPQSTYTSLVSSPSFPSPLRSRITKIVSLKTLKKNYSTFEARRQLAATYDIFLSDDRVVTYLPGVLGKVFYKGGAKRPIPVNIAEPRKDADGKRIKLDPANAKKSQDKIEGGRGAASPEAVAKEVEKALGSALVHLSPGTSTAVKIARTGMSVEEVTENLQAVVEGLVTKFVTKGWRNVRAIHVKGANTMAFPVWLTDELWEDDEDVLEQQKSFGKKGKGDASHKDKVTELPEAIEPDGKKRKAAEVKKPTAARHIKKKRKLEAEVKLAEEMRSRKDALRTQKEAILADIS